MAARVEIVNLALARLGESPIQSLDEASVPAATARQLYDPARQAALRDYNWSFALKLQSLAQLDAPDATGEFSACFALPADCLRAVRLLSGAPFVVRGRALCTNASSPTLEYVRNVTDEAEFDAKFVEALSYKLASELAMPIKGSETMLSAMANRFTALAEQAAAESIREAKPAHSANPYVEARG